MKISCVVHGQKLRFTVEEWDETDDTVIYRVRDGVYDAFFETTRAYGLENLAQVGVCALYTDGISDIKEEK